MNELVMGPGSSGGEPSVVGQRLHAVLDAEQVVDDLRRYFGIGLPPGAGAFTGGRFEHLAGGGDRRQVADRPRHGGAGLVRCQMRSWRDVLAQDA
jgi:hypothetical protein